MSKIGLIIQREYSARVKKKSFIVMTFLTPLLSAVIFAIPTLLDNSKNVHRHVVVVDGTHSFCGVLTDSPTVTYDYKYCDARKEDAQRMFADSSAVTVMYIPPSEQVSQIQLFSKVDPGDEVISAIQVQMNNEVERDNMKANNLDPKMISAVKANIAVQNVVNNEISNTNYSMGLAIACSLLIYFFIFLYSVQVMRGVMEEKVSRIVEIMISSVKPFQLMMGKVIGVGLVGLTQFLAWLILGYFAITIESKYAQTQAVNPDNYKKEQTMKQGTPVQDGKTAQVNMATNRNGAFAMLIMSFTQNLSNTNWPLILSCFIFYFLCGYLLYSSLFAAIGSAVDQETDSQQFMLPVTAPLILSYLVMFNIVRDPHSSMAFWFSVFPLTSPIAMMARIPFGISPWDLILSMALLIGSIFGTVWLAGRIYRVGLLMYGKKVTYKELGKWLFYK